MEGSMQHNAIAGKREPFLPARPRGPRRGAAHVVGADGCRDHRGTDVTRVQHARHAATGLMRPVAPASLGRHAANARYNSTVNPPMTRGAVSSSGTGPKLRMSNRASRSFFSVMRVTQYDMYSNRRSGSVPS